MPTPNRPQARLDVRYESVMLIKIKPDIEYAQADRHWSALIIAGEMQRPFPDLNGMPQDDSTFERHQKGNQVIYSSKKSLDALRRQAR